MWNSSWGGCEELWAETAGVAINEGIEVGLFVFDWVPLAPKILALEEKGAKLFKRPSLDRYFTRLGRLTRYFKPTLRELHQFNPDVILLSQGSLTDLTINWEHELHSYLCGTTIPFVTVIHGNNALFLPKATREKAKLLLSKAKTVAFVAEKNREVAARQLAWRMPNSIVIRNPVNLSDLEIIKYPAVNPIKMASVARLDPFTKGQDLFFEVLSAGNWRNRAWELHLFGSGEDREYLESLAEYYNLTDKVKFAGQVEDIRTIWRQCHLLVLPSRFEGTPLAMVEAMLCGRPAMVTDVGGNCEWIEDSSSGFVAETPTVKAISMAMEKAWRVQDNWEEMGQAAYREALKRYDPDPGRTLLQIVKKAMISEGTIVESSAIVSHI